MKKVELLNQLRQARRDKPFSKCTLVIQNTEMKAAETITFNHIDYGYKIDFIDANYDDNLVNKKANFISISYLYFK